MPFFEILQQYDFLVINCYYLTAGGTSNKKSWTFKDNDDLQFIRDVLKTDIDKIKADKHREQTRLSWEKKIDEEEVAGESEQENSSGEQ